MAAYLIANIRVRDWERFNEYRAKVAPIIESFGGRYLVRGGDVQPVEGDLRLERLVVLEFPSMAAARAFYCSPEYAPVLQLRLNSTWSDVVLVEGWSPAT